jgi:hypothetical protein
MTEEMFRTLPSSRRVVFVALFALDRRKTDRSLFLVTNKDSFTPFL